MAQQLTSNILFIFHSSNPPMQNIPIIPNIQTHFNPSVPHEIGGISYFQIYYYLFLYNQHSFFRMKKSRQRLSSQDQPPREKQESIEFFNTALLTKFLNFMSKQRNDGLRKGINNIYGRHYSINYRPSFGFKQQWQQKKKNFEENTHQQIFQSQKKIYKFYNTIVLLFSTTLLWYITLHRCCQINQYSNSQYAMVFGLITTVLDCFFHFGHKYLNSKMSIQWIEAAVRFKQQLYLFFYFFLNIFFHGENKVQTIVILLYIMDLISVIILYRKAKGLFRHFKIRSYSTNYKYQFKLLDLLINLLTVQHIFAIIMYIVSYYDPNNNWLIHIGKNDIQGLQRFYYAFYFTSTTMLTIGYGDIIPMNQLQILVVMLLQIFGVAIFSYVINEIGFTLSSIRKEQEELQHTIFTMSKMSKEYNLDPELSSLAKSYLVGNKKSMTSIYPSEEKEVLGKLNDDLREAITFENHLNLVKSSLFFVCHWSKRFQLQIAKRIQKKMLNPNELISQTMGKQRIYIIKSGKLQICTNNHMGYKKNFKKLLKTIQPNTNLQVCDNIYGYTSAFVSRPLKFNAVSKEYTCVYFIDKKQFLQCVHNDKMDSQYFFEVKARIQDSKFYQAWEAPVILNIREHYRPNQIYLIKKYVKKCRKSRSKRKYKIRGSRRFRIIVNSVQNEDFAIVPEFSEEIAMSKQIMNLVQKRRGRGGYSSQKNLGQTTQLQINIGFILHFEVMRQYQRYFLQNNLTNVLQKMQRQNAYVKKSIMLRRTGKMLNPIPINSSLLIDRNSEILQNYTT